MSAWQEVITFFDAHHSWPNSGDSFNRQFALIARRTHGDDLANLRPAADERPAIDEHRFPVVQHLASSNVPTTVIYGDRDSVVPPPLSAAVADQALTLAERVVIADADHNDPVMFGAQVADAVARLANRVN